MKEATQAFVIAARGVTTGWKFPLAYYFVNKTTSAQDMKRILFESMNDVKECGGNILAIVCDQGATNRGFANLLGITVEKPLFEFGGQEILFLYNICHLIKCLAGLLRKNGFNTIDKPDEPNGVGPSICIEHIKNFYEMDQNSAFPSAPKLRTRHFDPNHKEKMKLKLAAQLLSNSVYAGMKTMIATKQLPPDHALTANFCKAANSLFDICNISKKKDANPLKCGEKIYDNLGLFDDMFAWVNTLKYRGSYTPTLKGLKITISGMIYLIKTLKDRQYKWITTRRFQSDLSEHIFSLIKMRSGGNPTAIRFMHAYKSMFVSTMLRNPLGSNVEIEENDNIAVNEERLGFLLDLSNQAKIPAAGTSHDAEDSDSEFEYGAEEDSNDEDRLRFDLNLLCSDLKGLKRIKTSECVAVYMGAWAIKKIQRQTNCLNCKSMLEFHMDRVEPGLDLDESLISEKSFEADPFIVRVDLSYGNLLKAEVKEMFHNINDNFGDSFFKSINLIGTNVIRNLVRKLKEIRAVKLFLEADNNEACQKHRRQMLELFLRARVFGYFNQKSDEIKTVNPKRKVDFDSELVT